MASPSTHPELHDKNAGGLSDSSSLLLPNRVVWFLGKRRAQRLEVEACWRGAESSKCEEMTEELEIPAAAPDTVVDAMEPRCCYPFVSFNFFLFPIVAKMVMQRGPNAIWNGRRIGEEERWWPWRLILGFGEG